MASKYFSWRENGIQGWLRKEQRAWSGAMAGYERLKEGWGQGRDTEQLHVLHRSKLEPFGHQTNQKCPQTIAQNHNKSYLGTIKIKSKAMSLSLKERKDEESRRI